MKSTITKTSKSGGFTLIELLVVIAIIGMLASVILASLGNARNKAADARRKSDLHAIQTALELYYATNNAYPTTGNAWWGNVPNGGNLANYIPGLVPTYIAQLPQDPKYSPSNCGNWGGAYLYQSDGVSYKLLDHCPLNSAVANTTVSDPLYDPSRPSWAWAVCVGTVACNTW